MISTVTSKGQVTIPKEIRVLLQIKPSDKVDFTIEGDRVILKPIKTLMDFRGSVSAKGQGKIDMERQQAKKELGKKVMKASE